jgi:hypothetical protein
VIPEASMTYDHVTISQARTYLTVSSISLPLLLLLCHFCVLGFALFSSILCHSGVFSHRIVPVRKGFPSFSEEMPC